MHSNAIVLGSVLAKLELPLDSLDWHLEGDNRFGDPLENVPREAFRNTSNAVSL